MLAKLLLCKRYHEYQCDSQVSQWMDLMRGRGRQFRLPTLFLNPVSWAAFAIVSEAAPILRISRSPGLTAPTQAAFIAPSEAVPISRTPCPTQAASVAAFETGLQTPRPSLGLTETQAASVAASETGSRLGVPFLSPEWTTVAALETGSISRTPLPTQATSVAVTDPRLLTGDQCLICLVKDGDLRKCKHCSALMHSNCQEEL
jgi:hypothetical protein